MRALLTMLVLSLLVVSVLPGVHSVEIGTDITPDIETEDFEPKVWMCGDRVVLDDATEPGRISNDGEILFERINNYAFEGEQIAWEVLVMDKNGFEKIKDVYATIGNSQGEGNDIEVNCNFDRRAFEVEDDCNARILEEDLTGDDLSNVAAYYTCIFTVETADSMYDEHWVTVEAEDLDGLLGTMDENEYWFFNPIIALSIDGSMTFENVRPGTLSYSDTLLIGNDADDGSGVMMDMFISGTDFYDSSSSGAKCPITNQLLLGDGESDCDLVDPDGPGPAIADPFCYFATNGAYSTLSDVRRDVEGYVGINYATGFNNPNPFYGGFNGDLTGHEIMQGFQVGPYFPQNILAPGAEMALTFRLNLPEPCNGDFDTGRISFWGEAI
jgi:hypothetical protein